MYLLNELGQEAEHGPLSQSIKGGERERGTCITREGGDRQH
jgi:hypothetical protein